MSDPLLKIEDLAVAFATQEGEALAVDGVHLQITTGRTLGLVGESGCGKSVTALSILRLLPPSGSRIVSGRILFRGIDLLELEESELRRIRGRGIGMVFQEPMTSLNPVYTCGEQIDEVLRLHEGLSRRQARQRTIELLGQVGLADPARRARDYPHQLSGGMRQRVMIAMAVACRPALVIADEPTTALDVTIQRQILDLLESLREEMGMALLHITHDLAVIEGSSQEVAVMYSGVIVEHAPSGEIFSRPAHPYTLGLLACRPAGHRAGRPLPVIGGNVPNPLRRPSGCRFHDRCPFATSRCREEEPVLEPVSPQHEVACFEAQQVLQEGRWPDVLPS